MGGGKESRILLALSAGLFVGLVLVWPSPHAGASHSDVGCASCHVTHRSGDPDDPQGESAHSVPLWSNSELSEELPTYTLYSSATLDATDMTQPDGPSKLCLGCHDGTYADMSAGLVIGVHDLASMHPVSFTYDTYLAAADGKLRNPESASAQTGTGQTIAEELLDRRGRMQCTSCHDVHAGSVGEPSLRWPYDPASQNPGPMCLVCHDR